MFLYKNYKNLVLKYMYLLLQSLFCVVCIEMSRRMENQKQGQKEVRFCLHIVNITCLPC